MPHVSGSSRLTRRSPQPLAGVRAGAERVIPEVLWAVTALLRDRILRFDPQAPLWPDRDRLVVSSPSLLPLRSAFALAETAPPSSLPRSTQDELFGLAGGLPGQAIAAASGMALAEQLLARRFGRSLVDHRTWLLALPGDLETGVALEAAVLAGRFRLERLAVIVASPDAAFPATREDLTRALDRIEASGWSVRRTSGDDPEALMNALAGIRRARKPSLLVCDPGKTPLVLPSEPTVPRGQAARRTWLRRLNQHTQRAEFERIMDSRTIPRLEEDFLRLWRMTPHDEQEDEAALVQEGLLGQATLADLLPELVSLIGGAEAASLLGAPTKTSHHTTLACGPREPAMVGLMNGLALHGGLLPCGAAPLSSADRMRPALRFASLARKRLLCVLVEDSPDAASALWQQVEQLASLRAMPHLALFRPANAEEVAAAWLGALRWSDGPSVIVLGRNLSEQTDAFSLPSARARRTARGPECGGYVLEEATGGAGRRNVTLIASGPELSVARQARAMLAADGIRVAVVSLPCWELFTRQDRTYRDAVLGTQPRVAIEAASGFGWERWIGERGVFIGTEEFGMASGFDPLYQSFGVTPTVVCAHVHACLNRESRADQTGGAQSLRPQGRRMRATTPS
ncbi:transketolase [Acetobacter estunensis]|uniref:Transketolase n=1 Tax=Acetobacter estunensis TaxID=104097 RepID=A0A967B6Q0_9PROT|nr:transketolase C-terminal domain-containing protein [Acetobacter estunensis]NHO53404.1 transketolase [Acetobacter estunensis]